MKRTIFSQNLKLATLTLVLMLGSFNLALAISGPSKICGIGTEATYTVDKSSITTGYTWSIPSNAVIVSGGGTSNTIRLRFNSAGTDRLLVTGNGTSDYLIIAVYPSNITSGPLSGNSFVCRNQMNVKYTLPSVQYATKYTFIAPVGATIASNGSTIITQTGNTVFLNFSGSFNGGKITAYAQIPCGTTPPVSLTIYLRTSCDSIVYIPAVPRNTFSGIPGTLIGNDGSDLVSVIFGELAYLPESARRQKLANREKS